MARACADDLGAVARRTVALLRSRQSLPVSRCCGPLPLAGQVLIVLAAFVSMALVSRIRPWIADVAPEWSRFVVCDIGKHLGCYLRPSHRLLALGRAGQQVPRQGAGHRRVGRSRWHGRLVVQDSRAAGSHFRRPAPRQIPTLSSTVWPKACFSCRRARWGVVGRGSVPLARTLMWPRRALPLASVRRRGQRALSLEWIGQG